MYFEWLARLLLSFNHFGVKVALFSTVKVGRTARKVGVR